MPGPDGASSSISTADSEWESAQTSIKEALAKNRQLQATIFSELAKIAKKKRDNRLRAEKYIRQSCAALVRSKTIVGGDQNDNKDSGQKTNRTKQKRPKRFRGDPLYVPTNQDINDLIAFDDEDKNCQTKEGNKRKAQEADGSEKTDREWSMHLRKKFKRDPFRKWTAEYFTDPTGSRPRDNEDSIRRKKLMMVQPRKRDDASSFSSGQQQQQEDEMIPDTFFYHTSQAFTPKEKARLDRWLFDNGNSNENYIENQDEISDAFYEGLAEKLRLEHHEDMAERKKDKALFPTCLPRSAEDIRLYHKHCLASRYEFSKEESLTILGCVEETATASVRNASPSESNCDEATLKTTSERNQEKVGPDWQKICDRWLEVHKRRKDHTNGPAGDTAANRFIPITPYRCMVHYKRKLRPQPDGSFTPEEDELLLRYIAAMGPQFVWGYPQITDLASRLFPHKSSRRIYERTHFSQWHPLSKDTVWTKEEEMKLVLAMKIYSGKGSCWSGTNNKSRGEESTQKQEKARLAMEKAALRKASAHFHPYRQSYKVGKKWDRTFSPRFNYKPFSKEEDKELLAAVRSSSMATPFSEIARKYFPNRSSDQLYQRWTKIAPDKEVVEKYVPAMVRSGVRRGLLSTTKRGRYTDVTQGGEAANNDNSHENNASEKNTEALFDPSDFVVEVLGDEAAGGRN